MICPVCGNGNFSQIAVLKERLIQEWKLSPEEVEYINRQQGFQCTNCGCNLRAMTLADALLKKLRESRLLKDLHRSKKFRDFKLLEINHAGGLHPHLKKQQNYTFAEFPDVDIQALPYSDKSFEIIIHSDTLEHVENSLQGLKECYRVLKNGGVLIYTIPIVIGRLTKKRDSLPNSYHGTQEEEQGEDYKVWTEYGADFWVELISAGFNLVEISTIGNLDSLAICATKTIETNFQIKHIDRIFVFLSKIRKTAGRGIKKYGVFR